VTERRQHQADPKLIGGFLAQESGSSKISVRRLVMRWPISVCGGLPEPNYMASTHSLQICTRLKCSDGLEMSASTWSWFLRQNEHLRISTTSRRWPSMIPVWRGGGGSQDARKFNVAMPAELRLCGSAGHRRMLPLGTKRWLAFG